MAHDQLAIKSRYDSGGIEPEAVRICLLGGFRVSVGARAVGNDRWRLKKGASLVKLLALAPHHRMHRERVMDLLWPDLNTASAANNLYRTLHAARRAFKPRGSAADSPYLRLGNEQIELCRERFLWVDAEVFEATAAAARHTRDPAVYEAAADLYAGELLPEDRYEAWTEARRESLRHTYLSLLLELASLCEERGDHERATDTLKKVVAEDKTQEEAHAALIRAYVRSGHRREALLQYERLRQALAELDMEPDADIRQLYHDVKIGESLSGASPHVSRHSKVAGHAPGNLPTPLTSFVGREREVLEVKRALSMTRLLTLTGAGGSGKTRLALEVSRELVGAYPDGVWLAELASLSDPGLVPRSVAAMLGTREQPDRPLAQTICDHLGSKQVLLVLDNCEHLVDAAARFAKDLLSSCPNLTVLATSRESLAVFGEIVWPVPTLSLPDPKAEINVGELMRYEAVRLFVDRARSRLPSFELTPENARSVAAICRKLDGMPLAIELSTARMGALAVEQVAVRLEDSLGFLTGGDRTASTRHRTLRATLDWSYDLLSEPERKLFARLSVFAGGFSLRAAEAVGAGGGIEESAVPDLLSRLVDKSIVVVETPGDSGLRYGMLQPVRRYGRERLGASGEFAGVRRRHARWAFELAREVEPWLRGARREAWLGRLESEYGNLRAALDWALETGETELGLWFGATLAEFWYISGNLGEGRRWLEAALAGVAGASPARIRALARAGWIAFEQGDYERSVALSRESLALSRGLGDEAGIVAALTNLGWSALLSGGIESACALAEEAAALGRALDDAGGVARALLIPGLAAVVEDDHGRAMALHEESLSLGREAGDSVAMALSLGMAVLACLGKGDTSRARKLLNESFARAPHPRVMIVTAFHLHAAAALASVQGRSGRAARLWSAAESLRETIGAIISPVEHRVYGPYIASVRSKLDPQKWEAARAEGRMMTVEEAEAYALAEHQDSLRSRGRERPAHKESQRESQTDDALTRRQAEVAVLVAHGLTNAQIAGELSISRHTAANHVAKIIGKLNLTSRSQVAVWATERRLREAE